MIAKKAKATIKASKPKVAKKTKVIDKDDITVVTGDVITDTENFSPDLHGEKARNIVSAMTREWVTNAHALGKIITKANIHFTKQKQEFKHWLKVHCKLGYAQAMILSNVGKWELPTIQKLLEVGYTSAHVAKLQPLKDEFLISEFLDKADHKLEKDGEAVPTKEMTATEVAQAVKLIRDIPEEPKTEQDMFLAMAKKLYSGLENAQVNFQRDVVKVNPKKIELSEYLPDDISIIMNLRDKLNWFAEEYDDKLAKLQDK